MNNRQSKIINRIAQPIAKQLYANGWRNFEQIKQALISWLFKDDDNENAILLLTNEEREVLASDFIDYLKEYDYE